MSQVYDAKISGFKHAVVPIVSAAIACGLKVKLTNVPDIRDISVLTDCLRCLGCPVHHDVERGILRFDARKLKKASFNPELLMSVHGTIYLIPALAVRFGSCDVFRTGGCAIGAGSSRPIEHILSCIELFGGKIHTSGKNTQARLLSEHVPDKVAVDLSLFSTSVGKKMGPQISGASKTLLILAAALGKKLVLNSYYPKRDFLDLADFLSAAGFQIEITGGSLALGERQESARDEIEFQISSDSIEVVTHIALGALLDRPVRLNGLTCVRTLPDLESEMRIFKQMEFTIRQTSHDQLEVFAPTLVHSVHVSADPYGVYSDSLPFFALLLLLKGCAPAAIEDLVWARRFQYLEELKALGHRIEIGEHSALIYPGRSTCHSRYPPQLIGKDLRSVAALVLYSIATGSQLPVVGLSHLERGYENLLLKLIAAGIDLNFLKKAA